MNPTAIFVENQRWLWVVIYSRIGDANLADDVLQDVAIAVAKCRSDFEESACVKRWLYRVAMRQAMLARRKQARHRRKIDRYGDTLAAVDSASCIQSICENETIEQVRGIHRG
ncbi:MAG: sigma-70 family RNA polymerase sigma factor [Planctomycetota bacterium]